jgi:DNA-binding GntR family transcriptional regulator
MSSAGERAYELIRSLILQGELREGEPVREEKLASDVGVSRTPIREALRRLHAEGLVEFEAHRGARVASWPEDALDEIFSLRAVVEGRGARWAAERATPDTVHRLRRLDTEMRAEVASGTVAIRLPEITALNNQFHDVIAETGGGQQLATLRQTLVQLPLVYRTYHWYSQPKLQRSLNHHEEIVDALEAADGDWAEAVMTAHIHAARNALRNRRTRAPNDAARAPEPAMRD